MKERRDRNPTPSILPDQVSQLRAGETVLVWAIEQIGGEVRFRFDFCLSLRGKVEDERFRRPMRAFGSDHLSADIIKLASEECEFLSVSHTRLMEVA
jgi:hypothetical protein